MKNQIFKSVIAVLFFAISQIFTFAQDNNGNGVNDSYEFPLAVKFSPILHYHDKNLLFPIAVDEIYNPGGLNNGSIYLPLPVSSHNPEGWKNYFESSLQSIQPYVSGKVLVKFHYNEVQLPLKVSEAGFNQVQIRSSKLKKALEKLQVKKFYKVVPQAVRGDTIRISPDGITIRVPDFSLLYKLTYPENIPIDTVLSVLNNLLLI